MKKIRCRARAVPDSHDFGYSPERGTEQVGLRVQILDGDLEGQVYTWLGYFTEASEDRTLEQLRIAGWDNTDFLSLPGLGSTEFELQLEEESSQRDGTLYWKPTFINRMGVAMKHSMDAQQRAAFAARLRGKIGSAGTPRSAPGSAASRGSRPAGGYRGNGGPDMSSPPPTDEDINF